MDFFSFPFMGRWIADRRGRGRDGWEVTRLHLRMQKI